MSTTQVPTTLVDGYPSGRAALVDGATITVDASKGNVFDVTLGGSRTLTITGGSKDGQRITVRAKQDATGSRTLTADSTIRVGTDPAAWELTTTALKTDRLLFEYHATAGKWDFLSITKGH